MRFEAMDFKRRNDTLRRIFDRINHRLYGGELPEVYINIENVRSDLRDCWAVFRRGSSIHESMGYKNGAILFDNDVITEVETYKRQREQVNVLFSLMAHEMTHLYCYCHGINDTDHNDNFKKAAMDHGLTYVVGDDGKEHEILSMAGAVVASGFRL